MALYNFQQRFAPKIESGAKQHTIRAKRKRSTKVGEKLFLYTGLRQKGARKLLDAICSKVEEIAIDEAGIWIDGTKLEGHEAELLAVSDGFSSLAEMFAFWTGRMPFTGDLIHWRRP